MSCLCASSLCSVPPPCCLCCCSLTVHYSKDLLPLVHAEDTDVRSMIEEVVFLANKLILSEYNIRVARDQDPRLPAHLLAQAGRRIGEGWIDDLTQGARLGIGEPPMLSAIFLILLLMVNAAIHP